MPRFLVDEDLPRSLTSAFRASGFHAEDARDVGLRGQPDEAVLHYAPSAGLVLLTGDLGFANILQFPLGSHAGIAVARFPNDMPAARLTQTILEDGNLLIIEPERVRLRRKA